MGLPVDHQFDSGSGIVLTDPSSIQVLNLVTLGRVWGFLKYHHPAITGGEHNWDYDLFRVLPKILAARDREQANDALLRWIDTLGPVPVCNPCVPAPAGELDLRPELAWIHDRGALGAALSQRLEFIYANRSGDQFFVSLAPGAGNALFDHEPSYPAVKFPDAGYQLLALFRWWNIMQYWAPYRAAAGQDWNAVLAEFIPRVALAKDKEAYQLALFELTEKANDTHANLWSSLGVRLPTGECALPVVLRFLEGKAVVYRTNSTEGALKLGDVVNAISGVPVASLFEKVVRYYADSNEAARRRDVAQYLSRGACGRCLSRSPAVEKLKRYLQSVSEISLRLRHTICRETPFGYCRRRSRMSNFPQSKRPISPRISSERKIRRDLSSISVTIRRPLCLS